MSWFTKLFKLCQHTYEVEDVTDVRYNYGMSIKRVYLNQCTKCGKLKKVTIK